MPRRRHFPVELQAKATALAAMHGVTNAAEELNLPHQRVSDWLRAADSSDIRLFVQAKALEAAAEITDGLPLLCAKLMQRAHATLDNDTLRWNGTQLQAAATMVGIVIDKAQMLSGQAPNQRYGGAPAEPFDPAVQRAVLDRLSSAPIS